MTWNDFLTMLFMGTAVHLVTRAVYRLWRS